MAGPAITDLAIIHPEDWAGSAEIFGANIHAKMATKKGDLNPLFTSVGVELCKHSSARNNPSDILVLLARIAGTMCFIGKAVGK